MIHSLVRMSGYVLSWTSIWTYRSCDFLESRLIACIAWRAPSHTLLEQHGHALKNHKTSWWSPMWPTYSLLLKVIQQKRITQESTPQEVILTEINPQEVIP